MIEEQFINRCSGRMVNKPGIDGKPCMYCDVCGQVDWEASEGDRCFRRYLLEENDQCADSLEGSRGQRERKPQT